MNMAYESTIIQLHLPRTLEQARHYVVERKLIGYFDTAGGAADSFFGGTAPFPV